jgi:hypothetical protein
MNESIYRLNYCVEDDDYKTKKELLEHIIEIATGKLKWVEHCIKEQELENIIDDN